MRLELLPTILGVLFGVLGGILLLDAWLPERVAASERRRLPRRERDRRGEALLGLGVLAMAVTFLAGDDWKYSVLAAIAGLLLLLWGTKRTADYLKGVFTRRGKPPQKYFVDPGPRRVR